LCVAAYNLSLVARGDDAGLGDDDMATALRHTLLATLSLGTWATTTPAVAQEQPGSAAAAQAAAPANHPKSTRARRSSSRERGARTGRSPTARCPST